ncbi:MAG: protein kinase, partial [Devosia sp.]|nr:protein kinase [Devosia sp.]
MFGKRTSFGGNTPGATQPARPAVAPLAPAAPRQEVARAPDNRRSGDDGGVVDVRSPEAVARDKEYFQTKSAIFNALIDSIDLSQLATMDQEAAREEIRD